MRGININCVLFGECFEKKVIDKYVWYFKLNEYFTNKNVNNIKSLSSAQPQTTDAILVNRDVQVPISSLLINNLLIT